jgi:hypothetical protein
MKVLVVSGLGLVPKEDLAGLQQPLSIADDFVPDHQRDLRARRRKSSSLTIIS